MPIIRPQFVNGEIYHIIIRGIAGQKTFLEKKDYLKYIFSLYEFDDKKITFHLPSYFPNREVIPTSGIFIISY